jgi:hypothetical protein
VDISGSANPIQRILKYKGGGSKDSGLDLQDLVVKVGVGWVEQKLWLHRAGLPNESNILQDMFTFIITKPLSKPCAGKKSIIVEVVMK